MNWNKVFIAAAVFALSLMPQFAQAGDIGAVISEKFGGWTVHQMANGDLNGDGRADAAAILFKPPEGEDFGQALLVVFFDDGKDGYTLHTEAPKAICVGCGGPKAPSGEPLGELSIDGGQLHITLQGGSREEYDIVEKWRLDKAGKEFLLIGETQHVIDTVGEEPEETLDVNFLALKAEKTVGKKKHTCAVASEFKAVTLSAFDYDGKHIDDMEKISSACGKQ